MGIPAWADGSLVPRIFQIFPKHHPLTYPRPATTLSLDSSEPNHSAEAPRSHLPIQGLGPIGKALPSLPLTDIHTQMPSCCQEGPSRHGSSRPLPGGSILWCRPGKEAVPGRPDAANRFLGEREGVAQLWTTQPPAKGPKKFLLRK